MSPMSTRAGHADHKVEVAGERDEMPYLCSGERGWRRKSGLEGRSI